jgi:perosamine synthetase
LRIALAAMKEVHSWKDGDGIVVPAVTFVATVNVILQNNLKPFFVDVSMYDSNINPWNLERRIESKIENLRAVIPVHLFGKPCDPMIYEVARKYELKVMEDSCEMMGIQNIQGDIACYSTYVCHLISTGIGGLAITNDGNYAEIMRSYANHGRNVNYLPGRRACTDITKRFQFDRMGYSSRMTELEAALGLGQLKNLPFSIKRRREIATKLEYGLRECRVDLQLPGIPDKHAFMMYPILIKEGSLIKKWDFCRYLEKRGIETRDLMPIVTQPCYAGLNLGEQFLGVSKNIAENGFYVGCHPGMSDADVDYLIEVFTGYLTKK